MIESVFLADPFAPTRRYGKYDHSIVHSVIAALDAVPVHDMGSTDAVIALLEMKDHLWFAIDAIEKFEEFHRNPGTRNMEMIRAEEDARRGNVRIQVNAILARHEILSQTIGTTG